jgi:iron donor protein CyaY
MHEGDITRPMQETEYRKLIQDAFDRIEMAFDAVDPDIAECEQSLGALTIKFSDGSRCVLSSQPSVRQLWMAVASRGLAFHFNYDSASQEWIDDKGRNIELISYLKSYLKETTGQNFG